MKGVFGILASVFVSSTLASFEQTCSDGSTAELTFNSDTSCNALLAGQSIYAGTVCVSREDDNHLLVVFETESAADGWELEEVHLWIDDTAGTYPQTRKGNPKVGNFPYASGDITGATAYSFSIAISTFDVFDDICLYCDSDSPSLFIMAHAALRQVDTDGTVIATETGWRDGNPVVDKGSWATADQIDTTTVCDGSGTGGTGGSEGDCETAFGRSSANSVCFIGADMVALAGEDFNRWGWTQSYDASAPGTYTLDVYAAAGQCDLTKGTLVGSITFTFDSLGAWTVTQTATNGYEFDEGHVYVGSEPLPRDGNGDYTVAPGQYDWVQEYSPSVTSFTTSGTMDLANVDTIYLVVHSVACEE